LGLFSNTRSYTSAAHSESANFPKYQSPQRKQTIKPNEITYLTFQINKKVDEIIGNQLPINILQDLK
jgi:hypothetical protein